MAGSTLRRATSARYGTSMANRAPVAGALKMAATPAAAPATSRSLASSREKKRAKRRWAVDPITEPA